MSQSFASSTPRPLTAIIVGAGHRALLYASYAQTHPDELRIVGVADPHPQRREMAARTYGLSPAQCFESAEEVAARPQFADVVINGTMDHQHVPTSLPLLAAGYDMLLEKPFATSPAEMWELVKMAQRCHRKVIICHVLRYTPFYAAIRQQVADGVIGDVFSVQTLEHVSYHHMAVAYIRGKWSKPSVSHTSMLMAKCCHDLDLITWMKSGIRPRRVASFGSNFQFRPEKAPANAGTRCLVDCPIEADCLYSARKHSIDHPDRWSFYVWDSLESIANPTLEQKIHSLETDNPYGRCVWKCGMEVVDHQSLVIEFADGTTATHNMIGGTSRPSRAIHLIGTHGEIQGVFEDGRFVIRHIDPRPGHEYTEEVVDLTTDGDMHGAFGGHGGGDMRLVADFVRVIRGEPASISTTSLEDSVAGHLLGFSADRAMAEHRVVDLVFEV
ncbi:MAG TPA: Gfo/Idh/MocA family oxidoreductase [Anaerolineae bacterium]|nr:Gfo/Idh/MocA family oxidoreductase [Anaerolineae bacterium]HQH37247.1 Gfo/Idh/MocA family oxidoreductase [Anaerolineae bacterium]